MTAPTPSRPGEPTPVPGDPRPDAGSDARVSAGGDAGGDPPPPARVLLMGMMGAGKTSVGRALSARTGWQYLDNDELVRISSGTETRAVLDTQGVDELRAVESRALTAALEIEIPVIAAVAGGVVDVPSDLERLHGGGYVVWLRARIDTLVQRVGSGEGRPWLQPDPRAALERLYAGREAKYGEVASLVVDVDDITPDEVATRIVEGLRSAAPSG